MFKSFNLIISLFLISFSIYAKENERLVSNTTDQFIKKIVNQYEQKRTAVTLPNVDGSVIKLKIDYYYYKSEYLSIGGSDLEDTNSIFFIKGDNSRIYGWIHYKKTDLVYKYYSNSEGEVIVKEVPLSEIISVDDMEIPKESYVPHIDSYARQEMPDIPQLRPMPEDVNFLTLESKPESDKVIWLDISRLVENGESIHYTPEDLYLVWQINAAGFAVYDVNVTTDENVYNRANEQNRGYGKLFNEDGRSKCSFNGFGTSYGFCSIYRKGNGYFGGRTAFHEFGHLVGMADQGMGWDKYYPGFDKYKWVPIMGYFYSGDDWGDEALYQWSRGEYPNANKTYEIYDTIAKYFKTVPDDIPNSKPLVFIGDNLTIKDNYGIINPPKNELYDEDNFTFTVGEKGADVNLTIDRLGHVVSAMLDVHASILDEEGNLIIEDNPECARYAQLQTQLTPGLYTLRVAGGEEGNAPTEGFTRFSSIGYYGISGYITGASVDNVNIETKQKIMGLKNSSGKITLTGINKNEQTTFSVFQANGKKLFEKRSIGNQTFNLKDILGEGFYILKLKTSKTIINNSLMILK